jgi:tetratricopeptide (TPR) repeat protein
MTCHDMHNPPSAAERVSYYRAKCLTCHTGEQFAVKHHAENPDCTSCHMPKTGATNIAHVAWTDHRIRRTPDPAINFEALPDRATEVVPVFEGSGTRELGLAYYDLVTKGDLSRKSIAIRLLSEARKSDPSDVPVLRSLGVLYQMESKTAEAEQAYRAILLVDSENLIARTNLGTLLATRGKTQEAESLWLSVFNRNEDQATLGRNLAIVQCYLGKPEDAEQTLRRALIYSPDMPELRDTLLAIESDHNKCVPQPSQPGN